MSNEIPDDAPSPNAKPNPENVAAPTAKPDAGPSSYGAPANEQAPKPSAASGPHEKPADYDVGYKRTPVHTRYQTGDPSANPKGRPKGSLGIKARAYKTLHETITVVKNGKQRQMRKVDIGLAKITEKFMSGDVKAADFLFALVGERAGAVVSEAATEFAMPDEANLEFIFQRLTRRFGGGSDGEK
jgi:hypothetical protein